MSTSESPERFLSLDSRAFSQPSEEAGQEGNADERAGSRQSEDDPTKVGGARRARGNSGGHDGSTSSAIQMAKECIEKVAPFTFDGLGHSSVDDMYPLNSRWYRLSPKKRGLGVYDKSTFSPCLIL